LSGAFFPESGAATWLRWVMRANPLTYGLTALRGVMSGDTPGQSISLSLLVLTAFSTVALALAVWIAARPQN